MRVPISGILSGFRIRQSGTAKDLSEYGYLDILQPGNKDFDSSLTFVVAQDRKVIEYFLQNYKSGQLHWIDLLCHQVRSGREDIWLLIKVFGMQEEEEPIHDRGLELRTNPATADDLGAELQN